MATIEFTVEVFKTKNQAIKFINKHFELKQSTTVTIVARENGTFGVVEYVNL